MTKLRRLSTNFQNDSRITQDCLEILERDLSVLRTIIKWRLTASRLLVAIDFTAQYFTVRTGIIATLTRETAILGILETREFTTEGEQHIARSTLTVLGISCYSLGLLCLPICNYRGSSLRHYLCGQVATLLEMITVPEVCGSI